MHFRALEITVALFLIALVSADVDHAVAAGDAAAAAVPEAPSIQDSTAVELSIAAAAYDPRNVDWKGVVDACLEIGEE
jgi:ribosomal protein L12E/L44/L45/RPP1/RPP2